MSQNLSLLTNLTNILYWFTMDQSDLASQAIEAALVNNWSKAISLNKQLLSQNPKDVDALNRLAWAYTELGQLAAAKKTYRQVIEIDKYNPIAVKNIKKIFKAGKNNNHNNHNGPIDPQIFLAEPGKTKLVNLLKLAIPQVLSTLVSGQELKMVCKKHSVTILTLENQYVGALPDDLAHHLISLCTGGNKYKIFVKSAKTNSLQVFIREIFRSKRFINQPSFLDQISKNYLANTVGSEPVLDEVPLVTEDFDEEIVHPISSRDSFESFEEA